MSSVSGYVHIISSDERSWMSTKLFISVLVTALYLLINNSTPLYATELQISDQMLRREFGKTSRLAPRIFRQMFRSQQLPLMVMIASGLARLVAALPYSTGHSGNVTP